ncbi:MAG: hypothetical protein ABL958_01330 [Bdellovibrionia bacterium]
MKILVSISLFFGVAGCTAPQTVVNRSTASDELKLFEERVQPGEENEFAQLASRIENVQKFVAAASKRPVARGTHVKPHGCFQGRLTIEKERPERTKFGLFKDEGGFDVRARFANAWPAWRNDLLPDLHGLAVKVLGISGEFLNELEEAPVPTEQDFLANDIPNASTPDAKTLVELTEAAARGSLSVLNFMGDHPVVAAIFKEEAARRTVRQNGRPLYPSLYGTEYFSGGPYRLGEQAAKFIWRPCDERLLQKTALRADPEFLGTGLRKQALKAEICFNLFVQIQTDPKNHPIEDSGVNWDAPLDKVAQLIFPIQDPATKERLAQCDGLTFNPWRGLAAHRPLGNTNRARKAIYKASLKMRKQTR